VDVAHAAPAPHRRCPACGLSIESRRETCPHCLALLVDDAAGTVTCHACGTVCEASRQSCPRCLALLHLDPAEVEASLSGALAAGRRLSRPPGRAPFATGPSCTVGRLVAGGGLVIWGPDGVVEADLASPGGRASAPLRCGTGDETLFRLERYGAAARALVAFDAAGDPLATFLHAGTALARALDVRDEAAAPVARVAPVPGRHDVLALAEVGGGVLAALEVRDVDHEGWVDDEWTLSQPRPVPRLPLRPLAAVALVVAAKVLFGRIAPERPEQPAAEPEEELPGWP
jgi:hypothetical protein